MYYLVSLFLRFYGSLLIEHNLALLLKRGVEELFIKTPAKNGRNHQQGRGGGGGGGGGGGQETQEQEWVQ